MMELLNEEVVLDDLKYWNIPGFAVAVCQNNELIYSKGFGYRNLTTKEPMTPETLGGIASCSKSFTSAVIASLVDEGVLDYDTPVVKYMPDFRLYDELATKEVTLRDMLYHRTGLAPHDAMWPDPTITREEYIYRMRFLKPNKPFRSVTQYNNTVYNLIGCIAERVTGKTWENLVQERILDPLEMKRTTLTVTDMRKDSNFAIGYFEKERGKDVEEMDPWTMDVGAPAAGVNSCCVEMLNWIQMHIDNGLYKGKRLFSEHVMEEMHKGVVDLGMFPWKCEELPLGYGYYGMAWKSVFYRGLPFIFHTGEIEGYCTLEGFLPTKNLGMMLLVNKHKPSAPFISTMSYKIIDEALGLPSVDWSARLRGFDGIFEGIHYDWKVDLMKDVIPVSNTKLSHDEEAYVGSFMSDAYGKIEVVYEDSKFFMIYKGWKKLMEHVHYDTFKINELKEDTIYITMPMTYHYDEMTGKIDGFFLKLEPEVDGIWFKKCIL